MGILNVTPDSFFLPESHKTVIDGQLNEKRITELAESMIREGASILDIGAHSTRPGATTVPEEEELNRVIPAIRLVARQFPDAIISVDTFRSSVAIQAVDAGASIINDISGGTLDDKMFGIVGRLGVPYILMHIKGTPQTMQDNPVYRDVTREVMIHLAEKVNRLKQAGVNDIILDPGFGFGKSVEHNYELLNSLDGFRIFGLPVMAGISRKSMINKILGTNPENALNGTTVLHTIALEKGVNILRVHDVREAVEASKLIQYYQSVALSGANE